MASRDVGFSLHLASSEQQSQPQSPPQYRAGALPKLRIPSPFQSEESSLDLVSGSGGETPSTPGTPSTPLSPLGSEFSYLAVENLLLLARERNVSASDGSITSKEGR